MKGSDIKTGETYFFVATDSPARKHLEGTEFQVVEIKKVWRKSKKFSKKVNRYFNEFGEGARAEELEPLNKINLADIVIPPIGELKIVGMVTEEGLFLDRPASDYREADDLPF